VSEGEGAGREPTGGEGENIKKIAVEMLKREKTPKNPKPKENCQQAKNEH